MSLSCPLHSPLPQSAHEKRQTQGTQVLWPRKYPSPCSDALLQGTQRKGLDDLFRRLRHHHLAKISFLPAFVAGFIRVFSLNKPGIEKVPVLPATSFVAIVVKLPMSFVHTFFFSSHLSASAATIAVLVMAFAVAAFMFLIGGSIASKKVFAGF